MSKPFLSRHVGLVGSLAMLILCCVFFLVPFAARGARKAVQEMRNDVKDWLPSDFPETRELAWFYDNFLGEAFIVVTWPGCTEDDPSFTLLVKKLKEETVQPDEDLNDPRLSKVEREELRAHQIGDRLGLYLVKDEHLNWGGRNEKWLKGDNDQWYFITPEGELYRWHGESDVIGASKRAVEKIVTGGNEATGELVASFAPKGNLEHPNSFYEQPRKLTARLFKIISTGPDVLEQLAGEQGSLLRDTTGADDQAIKEAKRLAYQRLSGILFAQQPPTGFDWSVGDFRDIVPEKKIAELDKSDPDWESTLAAFVDKLVEKKYDGDREALIAQAGAVQNEHWHDLFEELGTEPPAPQTCILVTLSEPAKRDMSRAIGREMMGKPLGRVLELAQKECAIPAEDLKLGGPPVDNVAIDEEGKITLVRLVAFSAMVGIFLAYVCFRSVGVTFMVFFVGGVGAMMSLGIVWWAGSSLDAILMTMPSLVYVLGLSGAVHVVNYYREAVKENGLEGAAETAVRHGWFPCTLAAFTTALGLISLYFGSNVIPIQKFGLFAALGTVATLLILFTYLPSALYIFTPPYHKHRAQGRRPSVVARFVTAFWDKIGQWVVRRHWWVCAASMAVLILFALGLPKIKTSVHLLKLFDGDAKIIRDYAWLEENLCNLVPMELVVCVDEDMQRPSLTEIDATPDDEYDSNQASLQYDFLERAEMASRVQRNVEEVFGEMGQKIVGRSLSAPSFIPPMPGAKSGTYRSGFNGTLERSRERLLQEEYLRVDKEDDRELWRVSLRVGALTDVDYGQFGDELKTAVEPVLSAYRFRNKVLRTIDKHRRYSAADALIVWPQMASVAPLMIPIPATTLSPLADSADASQVAAVLGEIGQPKFGGGVYQSKILVLGADPQSLPDKDADQVAHAEGESPIDQTSIFVREFAELLENRGYRRPTRRIRNPRTAVVWHDPAKHALSQWAPTPEDWAKTLASVDCVVVVDDHADYDLNFIEQHAASFVDARDHGYDPKSDTALTAAQRKENGDQDASIAVVYTGIVPIVYKAQRTLLESLIQSIALAFVMIAVVMMILLRNWREKPSLKNSLNVRGGMLSMLPNVFPVVLIFGAMGHLGLLVDIGAMMTASVAMGVAVDDTIHFLNWFRAGLRQGMSRNQSIALAYKRCATAMTQTTMIGGFGLAVFALSTFTPTQQFGILMLVLLVAALLGDLIFLPALLATPLGRYFGKPNPNAVSKTAAAESTDIRISHGPDAIPTPHSAKKPQTARAPAVGSESKQRANDDER